MLRTDFRIGSIAKMHRQEPTMILGDGIELEENALVVATLPDIVKTPYGNDEKIISFTKLNHCPQCKADGQLLALRLETMNVAECHECDQFIWYRPRKE